MPELQRKGEHSHEVINHYVEHGEYMRIRVNLDTGVATALPAKEGTKLLPFKKEDDEQ